MSTTIEEILERAKNNANSAANPEPLPIGKPQVTVPEIKIPEKLEIPTFSQSSPEKSEQVKLGKNVLEVYGILKPKEIDEKALQKSRTIGAIGDSLKLLGQMYGAGKGAYIRENKQGESLTDYFTSEEKRIRDLHEKYNEANKRTIANVMLREIEAEKQHQRQQQLIDFQYKKLEQAENARNKNAEEKTRQFNEKLEADKKKAEDANASRERVAANRGSNTTPKTEKIDYKKYAQMAKRDKEFLALLDDSYYVIVKDRRGKLKRTDTLKANDTRLGAAYYYYLQEKEAAKTAQESGQTRQETGQNTSENNKIGW